ncbi:MAG: cyclic nucleotide-binding domain-containing protein [Acutalibacter sp.]|nr:cyclic nucleotide-binding domain-containing protein [Acutalibacter sp.]
MEQIRDKALLERLMEEKGIEGFFSGSPQGFRLVGYKKHELLAAPDRPLKDFLFILEGSVRIYGLQEDGGDYSVAQGAEQDMLGMMEFVRESQPALYTEALEDTLCIALPIEKNRAVLEKDSLFLRRLLEYSVRLVMLSAMAGRPGQRLAEKVVAFLRDIQPDHTLHSINAGLLQFRCSRRQLQRVVRKLCEDGVLKKEGKGKYQLR